MAGSAVLGEARLSRRAVWDATFVCLSIGHTALLLTVPSIPLIALGLWWNANTIAHNFIHSPFFRTRRLNDIYSAYLSVLLGFPQRLWRSRHLSHHAGVKHRVDLSVPLAVEIGLILALWSVLAVVSPRTFVAAYLPGWAIGLALCQIHGYYEHARGTRSYYGRLYNALFFNDGFHVEHHLRPGLHWTSYAETNRADDRPSRWPAVLRWLETGSTAPTHRILTALERMVLRSRLLQRFVLRTHERALRRLLQGVPRPRRVTVVGGGLFPRTALILRQLIPDADVTIVDARAEHLSRAQPRVGDWAKMSLATFDPAEPCDTDLVVLPLAFEGDRRQVYHRPPAPFVLVHDWLWSRRGRSVVISWLLLKRLNLIIR